MLLAIGIQTWLSAYIGLLLPSPCIATLMNGKTSDVSNNTLHRSRHSLVKFRPDSTLRKKEIMIVEINIFHIIKNYIHSCCSTATDALRMKVPVKIRSQVTGSLELKEPCCTEYYIWRL
ncbi:hypothetical protein, variant [Blastomyces dermatitidis ER-3]|uniref:Secreted protein n=1 Tax=Ajellomyces dermatitidis (strain ER-3 / ATCC MYA-2586) TaxID=559297 RepID=A0ABX2VRD8_AJEDR|nr:uncharacterized protein BDCG_16316 [Blastomyces dermatitidis ER-3]XP_045279523.1 hypothetical protein, variant [Blastomyces dermatitidis ER-3]OAS99794.1 hypothetical protein BDCG_16316 [Blastomyces dermatitidis ER-3]OAS99795.1 hypothetical protein, variant [Blastomyces dermatitidis ER-3]